ncbi:hypothetical protein ASD83_02675 [Devosia sp. Root685]|uniref:hypothetical protein n=1 Tax=Devosia sp. Root685 TaxID=1736587 RepID=UPI0006FABF3A|nr:hypothetical protein [Devosia sp. Root685]KRA99443.1 hypothetical protein ASD83_02675 [Devosia sp. Root685]
MPERRKIVGGMFLLTTAGLLLLVPPLVHIFNHDFTVFGVPQIVFYLFGVWLALIVGTAVLTSRLPPERPANGEEGES